MKYRKDDRVRLNAEGRRAFTDVVSSKYGRVTGRHARLGTVVSVPRAGNPCVKIRWDGARGFQYLHSSYLERAPITKTEIVQQAVMVAGLTEGLI